MAEHSFLYHENLIQYIWEKQITNRSGLQTTCGKKITITAPGTLNKNDGPDFLNAEIDIGGLKWHGAVEVHIHAKDWYVHGHQQDPAYNQIILHVVVNGAQPVYTENNSSPYTLNLLEYLPKNLHRHLKHMASKKELPCSGTVKYLNADIFATQVDKAQREYFQKKSHDFLAFYDAQLPPSKAWKKAFIISVFDGFGISNNREPMVLLAKQLLEHGIPQKAFKKWLKRIWEIEKELLEKNLLVWNLKGSRPANRPKVRIPQAAQLSYHIAQKPLEHFLNTDDLAKCWQDLLHSPSGNINTNRTSILYATVFLPALFNLGNLFYKKELKEKSFIEWQKFRIKKNIPNHINNAFKMFPQGKNVPGNLGLVHQHKAYCKQGNCHNCLVLKKAIQS